MGHHWWSSWQHFLRRQCHSEAARSPSVLQPGAAAQQHRGERWWTAATGDHSNHQGWCHCPPHEKGWTWHEPVIIWWLPTKKRTRLKQWMRGSFCVSHQRIQWSNCWIITSTRIVPSVRTLRLGQSACHLEFIGMESWCVCGHGPDCPLGSVAKASLSQYCRTSWLKCDAPSHGTIFRTNIQPWIRFWNSQLQPFEKRHRLFQPHLDTNTWTFNNVRTFWQRPSLVWCWHSHDILLARKFLWKSLLEHLQFELVLSTPGHHLSWNTLNSSVPRCCVQREASAKNNHSS